MKLPQTYCHNDQQQTHGLDYAKPPVANAIEPPVVTVDPLAKFGESVHCPLAPNY